MWSDAHETVRSLVRDVVAGDTPYVLQVDEYESGTGWPSLTKPIVPKAVAYRPRDEQLPAECELAPLPSLDSERRRG